MRHTRNRQLAKLHNEPMWFWNKEGTDDIRLQRYWMKLGLKPTLDPTFEWEIEMGRINFKPKKEQTHHMTVTIFRQVKTYK